MKRKKNEHNYIKRQSSWILLKFTGHERTDKILRETVDFIDEQREKLQEIYEQEIGKNKNIYK